MDIPDLFYDDKPVYSTEECIGMNIVFIMSIVTFVQFVYLLMKSMEVSKLKLENECLKSLLISGIMKNGCNVKNTVD